MSELIPQAAYAKSKGVSRQAINKLVKQGKLVLIDGMIDPAVADELLKQRVNPARSKTAAGGLGKGGLAGEMDPPQRTDDSSRFFRARADREEAAAARELLELEKLQGSLVELEQVERALFEASRMLRDLVLNVPKRRAGDLAGMTNAAEIEQALTTDLRRALEEFSKMAAAAVGETSN